MSSFGLVRGLAVFLGSRITSSARLVRFHRRFVELDPTTVAGVVAMEVAVGTLFAWQISPFVALAVPVAAGALGARRVRGGAPQRRSHAPPGCTVDVGEL